MTGKLVRRGRAALVEGELLAVAFAGPRLPLFLASSFDIFSCGLMYPMDCGKGSTGMVVAQVYSPAGADNSVAGVLAVPGRLFFGAATCWRLSDALGKQAKH